MIFILIFIPDIQDPIQFQLKNSPLLQLQNPPVAPPTIPSTATATAGSSHAPAIVPSELLSETN